MVDRIDYSRGQLHEEDMAASPFDQLRTWLDEARSHPITEPGAMCLSTVGTDGRPSSRFVLLRGLNGEGLTFFTNYQSRKGLEIESNPSVAVCFWWAELERQVRVEGRGERLSVRESDEYWASRPYESRLASAASPQSRQVASREELTALVHRVQQQNPEEIRRPTHWGGYRLVPELFEFWQGGPARLHDRLLYRLVEGSWVLYRLAP